MPDTMPRNPEMARPFLLGAVRLLRDMRAQRLPVQPARSVRARPGIRQPIRHGGPVVHTAATDLETSRRCGLAAPTSDNLDNPFTQILTASHLLSIADLFPIVQILPGLAIGERERSIPLIPSHHQLGKLF